MKNTFTKSVIALLLTAGCMSLMSAHVTSNKASETSFLYSQKKHGNPAPPPPTNLIVNGSFEAGNSGFGTDYSSWATTTPEVYAIWTNATDFYSWWCANAPAQGSNMLVADGSDSAGSRVWYQTVSINPNTWYQFTGQFLNLFTTSGANDPNFNIKINGTSVYSGTLSYNNCTWETIAACWYSGAEDNTATIEIWNWPNADTLWGNDYAIDNLTFKENSSCGLNRLSARTNVKPSAIPGVNPSVKFNTQPQVQKTLTGDKSNANTVMLYPNPVKNRLTVLSKDPFTNIQLVTLTGALKQVYNKPGTRAEIDVSNFNPGTYFVKIVTKTSVKTEKVIIVP